LLGEVRRAAPEIRGLVAIGGVRRFEPVVGHLGLVGIADAPAETIARLITSAETRVAAHDDETVTFTRDGHQAVLRLVPPAAYGAALVHSTGSPEHVAKLAGRAAARGLTLTSAGLLDGEGRVLLTPSEQDAYAALGLADIPPELRAGRDEVEAAANGTLPRLVTAGDLRGDLHVHTDWSDGRNSVEEVVQAARALGYAYVAITDHSRSVPLTTGLEVEDLAAQRDEVLRVQEQYDDIVVLHGAEVDILPDGRLDFPDAALEQLDIVLASLHDEAGQGERELVDRYLKAIRHPLVHLITHPTNRLIGSQEGYALDFDTLFAAAAETGTILEIDGAPVHLDMDGDLTRRAIARGAMVSIDSDAHRASQLALHRRMGVGTARRGWATAAAVANTRPPADLRDLLARKRRNRA
jgi:DNA polymerase (family 10)